MEAAIHEKDDLRCCTTASGEPLVFPITGTTMNTQNKQQESFAAFLVSETSADQLETTTALVLGRLG